MKLFLNFGHAPNGVPDPGACNADGTQEAIIAMEIGELVASYLERAGVEVQTLQSNSLMGEDEDAQNPSVVRTANFSGADIFVSLHCNACGSGQAQGTETLVYDLDGRAGVLADCIQTEIVNSVGTLDRGLKERTDLAVLKYTDMPACLVEMAFIDNNADCYLLKAKQDDFARAIARGITDYQQTLNLG